MKFITPCFVRVEDAERRKELMRWSYNLGYYVFYNPNTKACLISACSDNATVTNTVGYSTLSHSKGFDCGTNVELFKALAAMTPYNDQEQWFTDGHDWKLCHVNILTKMVIPSYALYHKADAKEIIKHFNGQRDPRITKQGMKSKKAGEIIEYGTRASGDGYIGVSEAAKAVEIAERDAEERMREKAVEAFCSSNCPNGCSFGREEGIGCGAKYRFIQKLNSDEND